MERALTSDRFQVAEHVHAREFDGEMVVLDLQSGTYFGLDEVGAFCWQALGAGRAVSEVAGEIAAVYDVSRDEALRDLLALADELLQRHLVQRRAP